MSNFNIMRHLGKHFFLQLRDGNSLMDGGAACKFRSFTNFRRCPQCVRYYHEMRKRSSSPFTSANSSSSSSSFLKFGFVGWYLRKLETHPVVTKSITSSLIFVAADLTSQYYLSRPGWGLVLIPVMRPWCKKFSAVQLEAAKTRFQYYLRLTIAATSSFSGFSPLGIIGTITMASASYDLKRTLRMATYALFILGPAQHMWFNSLSKAFPKTDVPSTLKKILMGQAVFGPIINTIFFSYNSALQGESGSEIVARLKRDLLPTLLGGAMFWPVCDFVTFKFIQVQLQPLMNSSCAYVWTVFLTYMANR